MKHRIKYDLPLTSSRHWLIPCLFLFGLMAQVVQAQVPVAIVVEVHGNPPGLSPMMPLSQGEHYQLGAGDQLVVGYFRDCLQETINGGSLTIGASSSQVVGGTVTAQRTECDGGNLLLSKHESELIGGAVTRSVKIGAEAKPLTLYGSSPLLKGGPASKAVFDRLDQPSKAIVIPLGGLSSVDLAALGVVLVAGATYRVTVGSAQRVFQIADSAQPGEQPLLTRLLLVSQ